MTGTLYLVPAGLGGDDWRITLPPAARDIVCGLRRFAAENAKSARAELRRLGHPVPLREIAIETLPAMPDAAWADRFLTPVACGEDAGLMSEAGCPGIADPGAAIVHRAHAAQIRVAPLVGPSSILLALMASGLDGQRFAFHGYLPVKEVALAARIRELEAASRRERCTQVFIEAPYRNQRLLRMLLDHASAESLLAVASDLTLATQSIACRTIFQWRRAVVPEIDRRPTVFLLAAC